VTMAAAPAAPGGRDAPACIRPCFRARAVVPLPQARQLGAILTARVVRLATVPRRVGHRAAVDPDPLAFSGVIVPTDPRSSGGEAEEGCVFCGRGDVGELHSPLLAVIFCVLPSLGFSENLKAVVRRRQRRCWQCRRSQRRRWPGWRRQGWGHQGRRRRRGEPRTPASREKHLKDGPNPCILPT